MTLKTPRGRVMKARIRSPWESCINMVTEQRIFRGLSTSQQVMAQAAMITPSAMRSGMGHYRETSAPAGGRLSQKGFTTTAQRIAMTAKTLISLKTRRKRSLSRNSPRFARQTIRPVQR